MPAPWVLRRPTARVEGGSKERNGGGPFLNGQTEREVGNKRELRANEPEHRACHDHHLQARDGEDMREA